MALFKSSSSCANRRYRIQDGRTTFGTDSWRQRLSARCPFQRSARPRSPRRDSEPLVSWRRGLGLASGRTSRRRIGGRRAARALLGRDRFGRLVCHTRPFRGRRGPLPGHAGELQRLVGTSPPESAVRVRHAWAEECSRARLERTSQLAFPEHTANGRPASLPRRGLRQAEQQGRENEQRPSCFPHGSSTPLKSPVIIGLRLPEVNDKAIRRKAIRVLCQSAAEKAATRNRRGADFDKQIQCTGRNRANAGSRGSRSTSTPHLRPRISGRISGPPVPPAGFSLG